jgi:Flp pilus assembly protein protease CpaA
VLGEKEMELGSQIITSENFFLIVLAVVWLIGAILQDLHRREVDNVWNFSLIGFAMAYRLAASVFSGNYWFLLNGFIGLLVFLLLGNLFYYSRMFAGGDAKLVIALGAILPLSYSWLTNFKIFGLFVGGFLVGGSMYVLIWSVVLVFFSFRPFISEYGKQYSRYRHYFVLSLLLTLFFGIVLFFVNKDYVVSSLIFLLFPLLFVFARSVEEVCMVKKVSADKLTVGDWLYEDLYVGGKKIRKNWEGLTVEELGLIREKYRRKVLVKYGVPFTPSFLIGFLLVLWLAGRGWF